MSDVLEVVDPGQYKGPSGQKAPILRVRCAGCKRVYVTSQYARQVLPATACQACRARPTLRQYRAPDPTA